MKLIPLPNSCVWCLLFLKPCVNWCVSDPTATCIQ